MASYVSPNVDPRYFETPVWQAPNELAFKTMQFKQAKFDEGLQQVQKQYQSNLNLGVFSDGAIAKRDAFMQDADKQLAKIATADFSLQENVSAANNIYKPLTKDAHILADLAIKSEKDKGLEDVDNFKTSKDEKVRNQYNWYSEQNMLRETQNFKKAKTLDDLVNLDRKSFIYTPAPQTTLAERVNKVLGDITGSAGGGGRSIQDVNGNWLKTVQNGDDAVNAFAALAQNSATPEDIAYYNSVAKWRFNSSKDEFQRQNPGVPVETFTNQITEEIIQDENKRVQTNIDTQNNRIKYFRSKQTITLPPNATEEQRQEAADQVLQIEEEIKKLNTYIKDVLQPRADETNPKNKEQYDRFKQRVNLNPVDYMAQKEMNSQLYQLANSWAQATHKVKLEENDFVLENLKAINEIQKESYKQSIKDKEEQAKKAEEEVGKDASLMSIYQSGTGQAINPYTINSVVKEQEQKLASDVTSNKVMYNSDMLNLASTKGLLQDVNGKPMGVNPSAMQKLHAAVNEGKGFKNITDLNLDEQDLQFFKDFIGLDLNDNVDPKTKDNNTLNNILDKIYNKSLQYETAIETKLTEEKDQQGLDEISRMTSSKLAVQTSSASLTALSESRKEVTKEVIKELITTNGQRDEGKIAKLLQEGKLIQRDGELAIPTLDEFTENELFKQVKSLLKAPDVFINANIGTYVKVINGERELLVSPTGTGKEDIPENLLIYVQDNVIREDKKYYKIKDLYRLQKDNPDKYDLSFYGFMSSIKDVEQELEKEYSKSIAKYDEKIATRLVEKGVVPGLRLIDGASGQTAAQYSAAQLVSGEKAGDIVDKVLLAAFTPENKRIVTLDKGEVPKDDQELFDRLLSKVQAELPNLQSSKGITMITSPIRNEKNRNPSYTFKFTSDAAKDIIASFDDKADKAKVELFLTQGLNITSPKLSNELTYDMTRVNPYTNIVDRSKESKVPVETIGNGYSIALSKSLHTQGVYEIWVNYLDENGIQQSKKSPKQFSTGELNRPMDEARKQLIALRLQNLSKAMQSNLEKVDLEKAKQIKAKQQ